MGSWVGDHGAPMVATPEVLATAELIRHLYKDLGQVTGGPLHVVLEDLNITDGDVDDPPYTDYLYDGSFERWPVGGDTSDERKEAIRRTSELILASFRQMPESWRAAAIGWYEGSQVRYVESLGGTLARPVVTAEDLELFVADLEIDEDLDDEGMEPWPCSAGVPCPPLETVTLRVDSDGRL